jgi:sec-independent protein translocase protein TatA
MVNTLVPLFPGVPGGIEMAIILMIAVLLFGANKIPKLARSTGQAMGEFQKGRQEVEKELQEMEDDLDVDTPEVDEDLEMGEEEEDFDIEPDESSSNVE